MSSITFIEKHNSLKAKSSIKIKPYLGVDDNMGLAAQGLVMFEGAMHEEPVTCTDINGVVTYITGLNESAPSVQNLANPKEKTAVITQIRQTVSDLEFQLTSNKVDPSLKNDNFWKEIKLLHPSNVDFWEKMIIRIGNSGLNLDMNDPNDRIRYHAIKAGGYSTVAPSFEAAERVDMKPKFFLDEAGESATAKVSIKRLRNQALGLLDTTCAKNPLKMIYIAKVLDSDSSQYRKSTPIDIIYDNMDEYIRGNGVEKRVKKAAEKFVEIASMDQADVMIRALVKDATFYRELSLRPDGMIYHLKSHTPLGKNVEDVVNHLKNPLNEDIASQIQDVIEDYWNQ